MGWGERKSIPTTHIELVLLCAEGAQACRGCCAGENLRGRFEDASFRRSRLRASLSNVTTLDIWLRCSLIVFCGVRQNA